uniref:Otopetrin n=1 Tax=Ditylenchus dipsaci TaxID=166011 RepID=A0A915DGW8_9BILA
MHLVAANLWTWIRYILLEEKVMDEEIRQVFARDAEERNETSGSRKIYATHSKLHKCYGAECVLASMSEIMYTSIVEYSLIGAAVMFIVWKNIDQDREPKEYVKRKHHIRIDCSKTTTGLFLGLAFLAATFTSMAVFSGYTIMGQNQMAATVFGVTDIAQYLVAILGCCIAFWQMRLLRYHSHSQSHGSNNNNHGAGALSVISAEESCSSYGKSGHNPSQELLDMILLAFGMTGEMIYSVAGLLGLSGDWQPLSVVLLTVHITRIVQVGLQSCLIYIAGKLRIQGDHRLRKSQPGKQAITFLLLANVSMFLMNLLEAEKAGVSETVINFYGKKSWVFLVRSFSPLTIFYRFHSSVCLAEIWKNAYSWKE